MEIDMSEKPKASIGDCNCLGELRSRSQFARAMWCIDEIDWPDGVQALKETKRKSKINCPRAKDP